MAGIRTPRNSELKQRRYRGAQYCDLLVDCAPIIDIKLDLSEFRASDRLLFSYQLSNVPHAFGVDDAGQSLDLPMAGFLAFTDANTSVAFAFR